MTASLRASNKVSRLTMQAAVLASPGQIEITDVSVPEPEPGQVRVRLQGCGVCASNLAPWEGAPWFNYPFEPGRLGHEGWGIVDRLGEGVSTLQEGDRVGFLANHSYAPYDVAAETQAVKLPDSLVGRHFPAEPLSCAVNILKRSEVRQGDTVVIIGVGFLGALLTQLVTGAGARVIAVARKKTALDFAMAMGAEVALPMDDHWQVVQQVKDLTTQRGADIVIEATGKQWPLDLATDTVREMGRLVVAGYHQDGARQVNMQQWNWKGLDVINAHEREEQVYIEGMEQAAALTAAGRLNPDPLFTHTFSLEQLSEALDMTRDRPEGFMKALVLYEDTKR